MSKSDRHFYEFGRFCLDPTEQLLLRDGKPIQLAPKTFETLVFFVRNNGHLLTKDELMRELWADTFVEENNLEKIISVLRKTLGENERSQSYIETIRRRGYRFAANVREINADGRVIVQETKQAPRPDISWSQSLKSRKTLVFAVIATFLILFTTSFFWLKSRESVKSSRTLPDMTTERLTNGGNVRSATLSPDGKYFVYEDLDGGTSHLWLRQTGQGNPLEIIPPAERNIYGTAFSPDGQFVYYTVFDKQDINGALYRVPTLGGVQTKLLTKISSPVTFSPDSRQIAFVRCDNEVGFDCGLIVASSDGNGERILLTRKGREYISGGGASWSPDGNLIAYGAMSGPSASGDGFCDVVGVDVQSGVTKPLTTQKWDICGRIAWTGDGRGFVLIGTKQGESDSIQRDQVWYVTYPENEVRRITSDLNRHYHESLGVTSDGGALLVVPFNRASQIWSMDAGGDSHTARQLTNGTGDGRSGIVTLPDNHIVYVARTGDHVDLWQMNADGTEQKQLTNDSQFLEEVRACANGRFLIFASKRERRSHLFRIDADGSNLKQLTFGDGHETDSDCSPDGQWVVYSSQLASNDKFENPTLWKIPIDGGTPVHLTEYEAQTPFFSPDGSYISYTYGDDAHGKIGIMSARGGTPIKMFDTIKNPELNMGSHWTPDGQGLTYVVVKKSVGNIWLQPINGDVSPRPLTDFKDGEIYNYVFSRDFASLFLARGHQIRDALLIKNFR